MATDPKIAQEKTKKETTNRDLEMSNQSDALTTTYDINKIRRKGQQTVCTLGTTLKVDL